MLPPPLTPSTAPVAAGFFRRVATSFKLVLILVIAGLLQIPLWMINGLLRERLERREQAVSEITSTWGRAQTFVGPVLVVPYTAAYSAEKVTVIGGREVRTTEEKTRIAHAYFLPSRLAIESDVTPSKRHRGIYDAVVYSGKLSVSGEFEPLDPKALSVPAESLRWDQAWLAFGLSDLRGTHEALTVEWNERPVNLEPSTRIHALETGLHGLLPKIDPAAKQTFSVNFTLNGSESLGFVPTGKQTDVHLRSAWTAPSFTGSFLPAQHDLTPQGFTAKWQVSYYGRSFPQQFTDLSDERDTTFCQIKNSAFGVSLVTPVDNYRSVERASKYGVLFITLLFTAFFLFEVLSALRLHAFHYLLVGGALCLFYLGLLSLSEFVAFPAAYVAAAVASTALVGAYSRSILRSTFRAGVITAALSAIYAFLFFVLQMQDYALVAGTVALFAVLGVVMYTTRKVDWSAQSQPA